MTELTPRNAFDLRNVLIGVALSVAWSPLAQAVCPQPPPKVCNEFFKSETVLTGVVESEQAIRDRDGFIEGWVYRVRVTWMFRGSRTSSIEVYTENASARFPLTVGREYLLFSDTNSNRRLEITSCGNSGLATASGSSIRAIQDIRDRASAVEGLVTSSGIGVPGVRLRITKDDGTVQHAVVSDQQGVFRVEVPPGVYRVDPEMPDVLPFDLSYDNPRRFVVQRGQCAQVAFQKD